MPLRDLFEIAVNPKNYSAVRIRIATSDEVHPGLMEKSEPPKPLITEHLNRNGTDFSVAKFLALYMITSVAAENTNV